MSKGIKPRRMRQPAALYRLVRRGKKSQFLAVRIGRKQRSTKETDPDAAKAFAYRWIATDFPKIALQLGIETTPQHPALKDAK